jgi:hypothetical protein
VLAALLRITIRAFVVASALFLAIASPHHHHVLRYLAAAGVALPAAASASAIIPARWSWPFRRRLSSLEAALRTAVIEINRKRDAHGYPIYPGDISKLGFHVWLVPRWYRYIFPYRIRRALKGIVSENFRRKVMRLKLQRAAAFRLDDQGASGVRPRKGSGIIGTCLVLNQRGRIVPINWEDPERAYALATRERWEEAGLRITKGLKYEDAQLLSERYGQAAAVVIRARDSDEAIGCVTIDLPRGVDVSLEDEAGAAELLKQLIIVRDRIEQVSLL